MLEVADDSSQGDVLDGIKAYLDSKGAGGTKITEIENRLRVQYLDKSDIPKILAAYVTKESYDQETLATNGLLGVIKNRVQDLGVQERELHARLEHVKEVQGHGASLDQVADVQGRL